MNEFGSFFLITISTFFPMIDPPGIAPIFMGLTEELPNKKVIWVALKSCIFALFVLLLAGFFGKDLFAHLGITVHSMKIVGGIIFFMMGHDMLLANELPRTKKDPTETKPSEFMDISLTPMGIPLIAGPGSITNAIILMGRAQDSTEKLAFVVGTIGIIFITFMSLVMSKSLSKLLGPQGTMVIIRLMGLLLMVIAVESFFNGLTYMVQKMVMQINA